MMTKVYNFNAGPSALPKEVLEEAQRNLVSFEGKGLSIMEMSHRSKDYELVHNETKSLLRKLLQIPDHYEVLFLQGGASLQFSMIPFNFLQKEKPAGFFLTGVWSKKAYEEAQKLGSVEVIADSKDRNHSYIPSIDNDFENKEFSYLHITSNNTIYGTQWKSFPKTKAPLIADMSSDIASRKIPVEQFDLIYAGAQKNLGPSGVTVVILKKEMLSQIPDNLPTMLDYRTHTKANSLYNTPPTFSIYLMGLVLKWIENSGGIEAIEKQNKYKAQLLYDVLDSSEGFYEAVVDEDSRSLMNIVFRLPTEELTKQFLEEAEKVGFIGLAGHRSVGGCRASTYNAVPVEACVALASFMKEFQLKSSLSNIC